MISFFLSFDLKQNPKNARLIRTKKEKFVTFFSRDCCPLCTILIDLFFLDISTVYENHPQKVL